MQLWYEKISKIHHFTLRFYYIIYNGGLGIKKKKIKQQKSIARITQARIIF